MSCFPREAVELLLMWYDQNARDLPWRRSKDPYAVLVSEIMLQQTRAETVKPYFARFMQTLPTLSALADADEGILMKLWEGLGYYSRVRNLQKAAQKVVSEFDGKIPANYHQLLSLPGVGRYTAGAVASIAYDLPVPAVDGNVLRVVSRLTGDTRDVMLDATKKQVETSLSPHIPTHRAGDFNQSLIELGALVCLPSKDAHCDKCPLQLICTAYREGRVAELPVRIPKVRRRTQQLTVFLLQVVDQDNMTYIIRKRPNEGLLGGLYEFPCADGHLTLCEAEQWIVSQGFDVEDLMSLPPAKHVFTHIDWLMEGYLCRVRHQGKGASDHNIYATLQEMKNVYTIPSAFKAYQKIIFDSKRGEE